MSRGIERIALKRFRGATNVTDLAFDPSRRIVLIFGENGTGKSTLIDAIDLLFNRSLGSLQDRSSATVKHLPAIGHGLQDLAVKIVCGGESWLGTYSGSKLQVRGAAAPLTHVLQRRQLIDLTEAAPAARYEKLRRFVDVEPVERCEEGLKRATATAEARLSDALRRKSEAEAALAALWRAEGAPGGAAAGPFAWAARKSAADLSATREKATRLHALLGALDRAESASADFRDASAVAASRQEALAAVEAEIVATTGEGRDEEVSLLHLLRQVQTVVAATATVEQCPICRQSVDGAAFLGQIERQIERLAGIEALSDRRALAVRAADVAEGVRERAGAGWAAAIRELRDEAWSLGPWFPEWASPEGEAVSAAGCPAPDTALSSAALVALLSEQRADFAASLEGARADAAQYNAIRQQYETLISIDSAIAEREPLHARLKQALEIAREQRIAFTQSVLGRMTEECNRLYASIHPEEALGLSRFQMDEKRRASLHQGARFQGHTDVPPQAYFSESHLDTLAFCLFLALAKEHGVRILALDDVFTSVDPAHLERVMELLIAESRQFDQIVITTHLPLWRDRCREWIASGAPVQLCELQPWSPEHGIRV